MQHSPHYADVVSEVRDFLLDRIEFAEHAGIRTDRIIIDPGIGFGKTLEHNIVLIKNCNVLCRLGYPVMIGASRKSLIAMQMKKIEDTEVSASRRLPGSLACAILSYTQGVKLFRVHDVEQTRQALTMAQALNSAG